MTTLNKVVVFRLSEEDYDKYQTKVLSSGYTASQYFREAVLENKTNILKKDDVLQLLYHLRKIGNNINQLAYRVNLDNFEGRVSDETYRSVLEGLLGIRNKLFTLSTLSNIKHDKEDELWLFDSMEPIKV